MRIWVVALVSMGCWTSSAPEPARPAEPVAAVKPARKPEPERPVDIMARFRDQMCACRDKACADGVQETMTRWSQEVARNLGTDRDEHKLDADDVAQLTTLAEDYGRCMMTAMTAGGSGANPCAGP